MGRKRFAALGIALLSVVVVGSAAAASPGGGAGAGTRHSRRVCGQVAAGSAACDAKVVTEADGVTPAATTSYGGGYRPADLASAYKVTLPGSTTWVSNGHTVAVVDAFDNPNLESDLSVYRSTFGLPACTTANGCFHKMNQNGAASPLPTRSVSWGQETSLDVDMASAVCPDCKLVVLEANSASMNDLGTAVNSAATRFSADAISNSYGGPESSSETSFDNTYFNHPGSAITVSAGDSGYGVEYPASSRFVTAVGGTSLTRASNARGWTETAWSGTGSGCSAFEAKPSWQTDTGCAKRAVADVSAVADPNTGVAVYDSYGSRRGQNWYIFGGTSAASPIIAAIYALAGNAHSVNYGSYPYAHRSGLNDVVSGSNGTCSTAAHYLCTAGVGYDGPTGLGTPIGTAAF